jgi:hypothetical protein
MRVLSSSHYYAPLADADGYVSLDEHVAAVTRERYRRIDRFVQLALFGAGTCAQAHAPLPTCGLYLSSGIGPIGSNVTVQDAIHRDHRVPMPFSFVNTLGSSACYHVAKDLGLTGESVLVARSGASFTAALASARADLALGIVSQVLVGAVEECMLPGDRHRALLRGDESMTIAEGSHWLLLGPDDVSGEQHEDVDVEDTLVQDAMFDGYESGDAARLTAYIARHPEQHFGLRWHDNTYVRLTTRPR